MQCWFTEIQWVQIINMNKANLFQAAAHTRLAGVLIAFNLKPSQLEQVASSSPRQFHGLEALLFAASTKDSSAASMANLIFTLESVLVSRVAAPVPSRPGIYFRHRL